VKKLRTSRRRFLKLAAVTGVATGAVGLSVRALAARNAAAQAADGGVALGDNRIRIEFDAQMRTRIWDTRARDMHARDTRGAGSTEASARAAASTSDAAPATTETAATAGRGVPLTRWAAPDALVIAKGTRLDRFELRDHTKQDTNGPLGRGTQLRLTGVAPQQQIEKTVQVGLFADYPGFAFYQVSYRNLGTQSVTINSWTQCALHLPQQQTPVRHDGRAPLSEPPFWSFCGSTHADRRDWVQPVRPGFEQPNFMGMSASDYGGGTPIVDVWRRDGGIAIGHLETTPRLVSLPLSCTERGVDLSMTEPLEHALQPGEQLTLPQAFFATHAGDYFAVLYAYRRIMAVRGIASPQPPQEAYESVWCAWGYERACTLQLIEGTLPKVRELGLRWAVIDDGWQSNVGDWKINASKYPNGEADMRHLVQTIRSYGLQARLWWAPLAAAPGSDVLHDHTDMLLLDKEGAVQNVSWWNSFYLCPAYQPTVDYMVGLVRKFLGDWGYAGLKIDGQHLNSVAPCYNPAHKHARPEESVEKLQDFFQAVYRAALEINPHAVVELCPCGTSYSFFNFRSFNQAPASDPESSWQVRSKGKTLKALMGPSAAFAGDHVELSTGGADFASTVGVGGIVSTKFTWPSDPKPKDSFLLTPAKEQVWRKWIALYNERQLPQGTYRGELYDIGFDKPETHVVEKGGRFYYAFYARDFSGSVPLRGLAGGRYRVRDYYNERDLGEVSGQGTVQVTFNSFLVLEAIPVAPRRAVGASADSFRSAALRS
jgi:alpha-galactosidase